MAKDNGARARRGMGGDALLDLGSVRPLVGGLSQASIRRRIILGTFPRPIVLSRRASGRPARVAWPESAIREWVADRIAEAKTEDLIQ